MNRISRYLAYVAVAACLALPVQAQITDSTETAVTVMTDTASATPSDPSLYDPYADDSEGESMEEDFVKWVQQHSAHDTQSSRHVQFDLFDANPWIDGIVNLFGVGLGVLIVLILLLPLLFIIGIVALVMYLIRRDNRNADRAATAYHAANAAPVATPSESTTAENVTYESAPVRVKPTDSLQEIDERTDVCLRNMIIGVGAWLIGLLLHIGILKLFGLVFFLWFMAEYWISRRRQKRYLRNEADMNGTYYVPDSKPAPQASATPSDKPSEGATEQQTTRGTSDDSDK